MNGKLLYILWKSVLSQIIWYHFCVVCVHAWINRRHCLREFKNRLSPKGAYSMYYVGISIVKEWIECIKWNALHILFAEAKSHTHSTHTRAHKIFDICGMIIFVRDVIWICNDRINTQIPIVLFTHHISNFGASRFWHSRKQCLLFIQAWKHTTKNDTKWFGIKHSFIRCIIIYCP